MTYVHLGTTRADLRARREAEAARAAKTPAVFTAPSRLPSNALPSGGLVMEAGQIRCKPYGLDRSLLDFLNKLDNKLVFQRLQVNFNKPTKYKDFFKHEKTVLKDSKAARTHWKAVRSALEKAEADKKVPIMIGPYFIPFGVPAQLKDPEIRKKLIAANVLASVEDFFLRISAMSLLKSHKGYFEEILKKKGNQLTIAGWPEYPFGWVGAQLGFETEDWQKLAKAYYDGLIELEKRTCTRVTFQPKPVTANAIQFKNFLAKILRENKAIVDGVLFWAPEELKKDIYAGKAFPMIWEALSGLENLFVTTIERVRLRSGKNTRTIKDFFSKKSIKVNMQAKYGQPLTTTLAQWLVLFATEWFALHDEMLRTMFGVPRGTRGPLGNYVLSEGLGAEPVSTGTGVAAGQAAGTAAGGFGVLELVGTIVTATGALGGAVTGLLSAKEATKQAEIEASSALEIARIEAETARMEAENGEGLISDVQQQQAGGGGPPPKEDEDVSSDEKAASSKAPLLLAAAAVGAIVLLSKKR